MSRLLKTLTQLGRCPEVLRCWRSTNQWQKLTAAYLGIGNSLPFSIDLATGPFEFREVSDIATFWQIFYRDVYTVRPDDRLIIDAGANIGAFTLYALLRAPDCHVIAVEPAPDTFRRLDDLVTRHGFDDRCHRHQAALGAEVGETKIRMSAGSQFRVTGEDGVSVPMLTLSSLISPNQIVDLLKIDVEGAEEEILRSTDSEVLRRIRRIEMEYHPGIQPEELFRWLGSVGFVLQKAHDQGSGYGTATLFFSAENQGSKGQPSSAAARSFG